MGLYGILAFHVSQRSHEMGVRMALGATGARLIRMVLGHGFALVGLGLATGIACAFALTRLLGQLLFEVEPTDPGTFVSVSVFLAVVTLLACLVPAWRATRVSSADARHSE
ncbi:MAG: FtsX-like permease family protein [Acidobacteria bacterium]|nr:MAG: FtsX-like permease family protein [Acidobacteriota bacterium]